VNDDFNTYLDAIGLARILRERVETISNFYEPLCPEPLADIFITDYVAEEEGRRFENLWFFSEHYMMEAKFFASQDSFDFAPIPHVLHWVITKSEYDFERAGATSRMTVSFNSPELSGVLRATAENCDYLRDILIKYFNPATFV
jgi:hypothetical protein